MHFVFYGNTVGEKTQDDKSITIFEAEKWDVMYPIQRDRSTIRNLYAPKRYLTIYDFNWSVYFKDLIEKLKS